MLYIGTSESDLCVQFCVRLQAQIALCGSLCLITVMNKLSPYEFVYKRLYVCVHYNRKPLLPASCVCSMLHH